jgi:heme O synthase-like polyprenyltransferase
MPSDTGFNPQRSIYRSMIKDLLQWLTKPGIIYGNAITTTAADFFLGYHNHINWALFFAG